MILLIHRESQLHTPMYFLLSYLSFMDILHISNTVSKVITDFLSGNRTISFAGCGLHIFLSFTLLGCECLAAMSYDLYVAICHPLRYPILMNDYVSILMAGGSWHIGTVSSILHTAYTLHFSLLCGIIFLLVYLSLIFSSHVQICLTVFQMKSSETRKKYHIPGQYKFLAIFRTILTPSFNPIIYNIRNKDVLDAMKNMIKSNFLHKNSRENA
uniref:G-protein coupled receptors family 1 profile domain-containing protein n=1 Tax=Sus scrofa TaxID=9823 RepID=A0A4X1U015_PIG